MQLLVTVNACAEGYLQRHAVRIQGRENTVISHDTSAVAT